MLVVWDGGLEGMRETHVAGRLWRGCGRGRELVECPAVQGIAGVVAHALRAPIGFVIDRSRIHKQRTKNSCQYNLAPLPQFRPVCRNTSQQLCSLPYPRELRYAHAYIADKVTVLHLSRRRHLLALLNVRTWTYDYGMCSVPPAHLLSAEPSPLETAANGLDSAAMLLLAKAILSRSTRRAKK